MAHAQGDLSWAVPHVQNENRRIEPGTTVIGWRDGSCNVEESYVGTEDNVVPGVSAV